MRKLRKQDSSQLLTPFITSSEGIGGRIKQIPEDFIVSEILENNQIIDPRSTGISLPGKTGLFLHSVLVKRDIDTSDALDWIAKLWKVPRNNISIAGSKDKRALTAQRFCVWGLKERFEQGMLNEINLPTIQTKSMCLRLKELRLGDLQGNLFEIKIRNIDKTKEETQLQISDTFNEIKERKGVLNGFGLQRFGDLRPITHLVGEKLIQGNFKEAIKTYIGMFFDNEAEDIKEARKIFWETENCKESLERFPKFLTIERKMLKDLIKQNMNYKKVLMSLPFQFQKLFIHAYQAYLFNKYLTVRWSEFNQNLHEPIDGEKVKENLVYAPIVGRKTTLTGEVKKIYQRIFDKETIKFNDFQNPIVQKLGGKGTFRTISFMPKNLQLRELENDDLNTNKIRATISFDIQKGSYATELLREIMKIQTLS